MTPPDELPRLLAALADGELTDDEERRLADALRRDPRARTLYLDHVALLTALHWEYAAAAVPEPVGPGRSVPRWAVGLAAAVLVAAGWAAGRLTSPAPTAQVPAPGAPDRPRAPAPVPGPAARAAQHAAGVAADPAPAAQLEAFERLAAEVRADAVRRAAAGDLDPLPRLAGLHDRVLKLGAARQLARVPEAARAAAAARVADGLDRAADEVAAAAGGLPPVVGDLLRPLAASCRETGAALGQGGPPPAPPDWPSPPTPLEAVAAQAIRVADAADPLARAGEAAHLAAALAQVAAGLSVAGADDDATRVGEAMGGVLEHGVAANLDRVTAADPAGRFRKEVSEVRERAGRAADVLERNLARAPPAARAGLERALAASEAGRGKAAGKGAGKPAGTGPPWKKNDGDHPGKGGNPPGWQKKS